ncbi:hypothetical protein [Flavobacterium microcysteis]
MKKLFILLISVASFISCSDPDEVTYSGNPTFVGFEQNVYNLRVPRDLSLTQDIKFASSSVSSVARTYNVTILSDVSDADPATYSIPTTFTIPANERFGILRVTATDNNLIDATVKKVVLKLSGLGEKETTDSEILSIFIYEFCPIVVSEFSGLFDAETWLRQGGSTHQIDGGTAENTLIIDDFFLDSNPDFVITYDDNNKVTFASRKTGRLYQGNDIYARMSTSSAQVSEIDACTGRITLWVEYYVPALNGTFGVMQEVFQKQ